MKLKGACPKCEIRQPVGSPDLVVMSVGGPRRMSQICVDKRALYTGISLGGWEVGAVPTPKEFVKNYRNRWEVARFRSRALAKKAIRIAKLRVLEIVNRMPPEGCKIHSSR